jgi:hypothetical protein
MSSWLLLSILDAGAASRPGVTEIGKVHTRSRSRSVLHRPLLLDARSASPLWRFVVARAPTPRPRRDDRHGNGQRRALAISAATHLIDHRVRRSLRRSSRSGSSRCTCHRPCSPESE